MFIFLEDKIEDDRIGSNITGAECQTEACKKNAERIEASNLYTGQQNWIELRIATNR